MITEREIRDEFQGAVRKIAAGSAAGHIGEENMAIKVVYPSREAPHVCQATGLPRWIEVGSEWLFVRRMGLEYFQ